MPLSIFKTLEGVSHYWNLCFICVSSCNFCLLLPLHLLKLSSPDHCIFSLMLPIMHRCQEILAGKLLNGGRTTTRVILSNPASGIFFGILLNDKSWPQKCCDDALANWSHKVEGTILKVHSLVKIYSRFKTNMLSSRLSETSAQMGRWAQDKWKRVLVLKF